MVRAGGDLQGAKENESGAFMGRKEGMRRRQCISGMAALKQEAMSVVLTI